jgi:hypothetical protein
MTDTPVAVIFFGDTEAKDHAILSQDHADPARLLPLLHNLIDQVLAMATAKAANLPQEPHNPSLDYGTRA